MDEQGHLMVIATFSVGRGGMATVQEVSLTMTDEHWLPYESAADKVMLEAAVRQHRRFTKSLRYNLAAAEPMASLVLTDTEPPTVVYLVQDDDELVDITTLEDETGVKTWAWGVAESGPQLPPATARSTVTQ
jgi:hypothetical protein